MKWEIGLKPITNERKRTDPNAISFNYFFHQWGKAMLKSDLRPRNEAHPLKWQTSNRSA